MVPLGLFGVAIKVHQCYHRYCRGNTRYIMGFMDFFSPSARHFREQTGLPDQYGRHQSDVHDALHVESGYGESMEDEARQTGYDQAKHGVSRAEAERLLRRNPPPDPRLIPLFWEGYDRIAGR